ncbi:MAG: DUF211 domain-containing protein [Candidatus Aenigmarchaeota archaeon]|nr:DUF211 domain-containing protein [Candidatus Aenigmarchaeota archaeon]
MSLVRRLVLDVLKPHSPSIVELSQMLADTEGIDGVDITVYEIDRKVENVKVTLEGSDVNMEEVERIIQENGGTVHSVDKVSTGRKIVEEARTLQ